MLENVGTLTTGKKKKLFGIRTKLQFYKIFHRKLDGYKNEKKKKNKKL